MDSSFSQTAHQTKQKGKRKGNKDVLFSSDDGFLGRLNVCLSLQKQYRDMLRSLKDGLGGSHNLSMTPSVLQPSKRSNITNSTSNLMSPSAAGSPLRLSFSQSKFMLTVDFCWLELIISVLCLSVVCLLSHLLFGEFSVRRRHIQPSCTTALFKSEKTTYCKTWFLTQFLIPVRVDHWEWGIENQLRVENRVAWTFLLPLTLNSLDEILLGENCWLLILQIQDYKQKSSLLKASWNIL